MVMYAPETCSCLLQVINVTCKMENPLQIHTAFIT